MYGQLDQRSVPMRLHSFNYIINDNPNARWFSDDNIFFVEMEGGCRSRYSLLGRLYVCTYRINVW
jgi:hypothetical protein